MFPGQQTLVFHSRIMAKVHEQAELAACRGEVVQNLRAMFVH